MSKWFHRSERSSLFFFQNEIAVLRTEVAQLKALLLAHKDCPVTMQQQKAFIDQVNQVNSGKWTYLAAIFHVQTCHALVRVLNN